MPKNQFGNEKKLPQIFIDISRNQGVSNPETQLHPSDQPEFCMWMFNESKILSNFRTSLTPIFASRILRWLLVVFFVDSLGELKTRVVVLPGFRSTMHLSTCGSLNWLELMTSIRIPFATSVAFLELVTSHRLLWLWLSDTFGMLCTCKSCSIACCICLTVFSYQLEAWGCSTFWCIPSKWLRTGFASTSLSAIMV